MRAACPSQGRRTRMSTMMELEWGVGASTKGQPMEINCLIREGELTSQINQLHSTRIHIIIPREEETSHPQIKEAIGAMAPWVTIERHPKADRFD